MDMAISHIGGATQAQPAQQTGSTGALPQAAADQTGPRPHSRQASVEMTGAGTPMFGPRHIPESPQGRPLTPSVASAGGSFERKEEKRDGLGASASPSVRNLLS